jgi:hypothetical protein
VAVATKTGRERWQYLWIEAVDDLESARLRIQELSCASYGEYFVFDQNNGQSLDKCAMVPDTRSE